MQNEASFNSTREYDPNALLRVSESRVAYYTVKRIIDFGLAFILLILLFPVMLLTAIANLIYSPGLIFFKQERVGVTGVH
ncbi:MAG: sugar transferase [Anaerolineales bacterium]|nr:sugar transferase [Anaerolineales bacterium]